jgi:hypothetical protein
MLMLLCLNCGITPSKEFLVDTAKLQSIVDVIFAAAGEFLPFPARLVLKLLKTIVDNRVVPQLAAKFRVTDSDVDVLGGLAYAAPDQLRFVVQQIINLLREQLSDSTLIALVDSLSTFITGALLDLIWERLVPTQADVIGALDPTNIKAEADVFARSLSIE